MPLEVSKYDGIFITQWDRSVCQCNATNIGETSRRLRSRYCEHLGVSPRTFKPISNPLKSSIRDHSETKNHSFSISNSIVLHKSKSQDLRLFQSMLIHELCPNLNAQNSSTPLKSSG